MSAYAEALRAAVRADSVVLDIGTGTGILALLAARFGAAKVYAIEPAEIIQTAREVAADNGLADRIEFIQGLSTSVELPERADLIVSDLRGVLPLSLGHLPAILDARRRLLAPGGALIPRRDVIWASLADAEEAHDATRRPWLENPYGLQMPTARELALNSMRKVRLDGSAVVGTPQPWATLDYARVETSDAAGPLSWTLEESATASGLCLWFDAELGEGVGFSNAPATAGHLYGQAFFPWLEAVDLAAGDRVDVEFRADRVGEDYVWSWQTTITGCGGGEARYQFRQSTFHARPLSAAELGKRAGGFRPTRSSAADEEHLVLGLMDGDHTLSEIAAELRRRHPDRYPRPIEALDRVAELSRRFSG